MFTRATMLCGAYIRKVLVEGWSGSDVFGDPRERVRPGGHHFAPVDKRIRQSRDAYSKQPCRVGQQTSSRMSWCTMCCGVCADNERNVYNRRRSTYNGIIRLCLKATMRHVIAVLTRNGGNFFDSC